MASAPIAALCAVFAWWFSTGLILMGVRLAERRGLSARRTLVIYSFPLFVLGAALLWYSLTKSTAQASYAGFGGALLLWGWIETAFLAGIITGPNNSPCPPRVGLQWGERFVRAWGTVAYHDMLLLLVMLSIWKVSAGAINQTGLWVFVILFFARISAQLNLYAGVPRINIEFIPAPMAHLPSHFRNAPINWLFPISILVLSWASACWLERLFASQAAAQVVEFSLLAALTGLALLEHWLMVLPLPDAKLWRWMLPEKGRSTKKQQTEEVHGF